MYEESIILQAAATEHWCSSADLKFGFGAAVGCNSEIWRGLA
jgi:hypothetical protein